MLTEEEFTTAMEKAVAERGKDFVYPDEWRVASVADNDEAHYGPCRYSLEDGTPACIIGVAMKHAGLEVPDPYIIAAADDVLVGEVPDHVAEAASQAQMEQDARNPWGEALEKYRAALKWGPTEDWEPDEELDE